jgi:hypothetical protein
VKKDIKGAMRNTALLLVILVQLTLITCPANAIISWTNKNGSADFFNWYNGGSDNGLFGSPALVGGNTFLFTPSNFIAESLNGIPSIKSDRLEVSLLAHTGYTITGIRITEYGDYGILGTGKVSVSGTMFAANLNAFDVHYGNFISTPTSPIITGTGDWSAQASVTDINWTNFTIVLNNNLMAISSPGSAAFIEKKVVGAVAIELLGSGGGPSIPEPASIVILLIGTAVFLRKK